MKTKFYVAGIASLLLIALCVALPARAHSAAPARDFLTPLEEERVKEAQALDKRIEVFVKATERRLLALTDPNAAASKPVQKDLEKWGELPTGTRSELIMDIANILDAAVTNIDDVARRDEKNALIPKALRRLAEAATRLQTQVVALRQQTEADTERRAFEQVLTNVREILDAAANLPPEEKKKG